MYTSVFFIRLCCSIRVPKVALCPVPRVEVAALQRVIKHYWIFHTSLADDKRSQLDVIRLRQTDPTVLRNPPGQLSTPRRRYYANWAMTFRHYYVIIIIIIIAQVCQFKGVLGKQTAHRSCPWRRCDCNWHSIYQFREFFMSGLLKQ